jgi:hypothetical protein
MDDPAHEVNVGNPQPADLSQPKAGERRQQQPSPIAGCCPSFILPMMASSVLPTVRV